MLHNVHLTLSSVLVSSIFPVSRAQICSWFDSGKYQLLCKPKENELMDGDYYFWEWMLVHHLLDSKTHLRARSMAKVQLPSLPSSSVTA